MVNDEKGTLQGHFLWAKEQSIHLEKNKPERSIMANKNTSDSIEAYIIPCWLKLGALAELQKK